MNDAELAPARGWDTEFCRTLYDDFKKQAHIRHIEPTVRAETYDDPALLPIRERCPNVDFCRTLGVPANWDTTGWTDEDWEAMGTPTYGLGNFAIYHVDINNNPADGEETVFYYEGEKTIVSQLPVGQETITKEIINPSGRKYRLLDLKACSVTGDVHINFFGSAKWSSKRHYSLQAK